MVSLSVKDSSSSSSSKGQQGEQRKRDNKWDGPSDPRGQACR